MYYNPFDIAKYSDEQLVEQIKKLLDECDDEAESVTEMSENIMKLSDVLYIYGELQTRTSKEYSLVKYQNDIREVKLAHDIKKESDEKATASYFNALAQERMIIDYTREVELKENVDKLKLAYDATQEKINAIKKKMEAKRFEFN